MIREVERVAALDAQELAVNPRPVAIVTPNNLVVADTERGLATIGTMRANRAHMLHLPRPRLVAIRSAGQRAHRTDVDAGAALVAFQVVAIVGGNFRNHAAIDHAQRAHSHAFIADAHAAEAENAARRIEEDDWRKLLFGRVDLGFGVSTFPRAVAEHHVLQFALAALIAHRAIERMVGQQELEHVFARVADLFGVGAHDHAFGDHLRAGGLHLRHLFDFDQAHAARAL